MQQKRPYILQSYSVSWAQRFEDEKKTVLSILGDEALNIEHIGSTSIPNMIAKPQIDVLIEVKSLDMVSSEYQRKFANAGYQYHGDYSKIGELYFTRDDVDGMRLTSLHILEQGNSEIDDILCFRDYLRAHEDERQRYADTKIELNQKYSEDYPAYSQGKNEVIQALLKNARSWRGK